ncbi:MAG: hypothetical protein ABNG97_09730 [Sulfitobacter sp.]|jgi:hypothetical protein
MARHKGQNGKAKLGANFVAHLTNWSFNEKAAMHDHSAAGDAWAENEAGILSWSGSITMRLDHEDAANQTPRAGDALAVEFYSEGDASTKKYFSGNAIIEDHGASVPYDGGTERTYSVVGNGPLAVATVP